MVNVRFDWKMGAIDCILVVQLEYLSIYENFFLFGDILYRNNFLQASLSRCKLGERRKY